MSYGINVRESKKQSDGMGWGRQRKQKCCPLRQREQMIFGQRAIGDEEWIHATTVTRVKAVQQREQHVLRP